MFRKGFFVPASIVAMAMVTFIEYLEFVKINPVPKTVYFTLVIVFWASTNLIVTKAKHFIGSGC